jgi:hypothetical protein
MKHLHSSDKNHFKVPISIRKLTVFKFLISVWDGSMTPRMVEIQRDFLYTHGIFMRPLYYNMH